MRQAYGRLLASPDFVGVLRRERRCSFGNEARFLSARLDLVDDDRNLSTLAGNSFNFMCIYAVFLSWAVHFPWKGESL